jgi:hypothetical protein
MESAGAGVSTAAPILSARETYFNPKTHMDLSKFSLEAIESLDLSEPHGDQLKGEIELAVLEAMNENGEKGLREAIRTLNQYGHRLTLVARDGELSEYSEILSDGVRTFQIRACVSDEFSYVDARYDAVDGVGMTPEDEALESLRQAFYQRYVEIVSNTDTDRFAELEEAVRHIYAIGLLQGEVSDGGFSQYFWNTDGQLAAATLEILKRIGAKECASLLHRAIKLYGPPPTDDLDEWYDRLEKAESEHQATLEELDGGFYESIDDLPVLVMNYLQAEGHE